MTLTLAIAALVLTAAAQATGPKLNVRISQQIVSTWRCEDKRQIPRTRAASPWKPHSAGWQRWQLNTWTNRHRACLQALHARDAILRKLRAGLTGTPMSGSEAALEAAGRRYGVSPFFIAAIAGTESSFGHAACRSNRFNAFGLSSCGSGWHVPAFRSWSDAYLFMAAFLTGNTRVTSGWPNARTTYDYHGYAACSSCWGEKTASHMRQRFGVGPEVAYQ